MKKKKGRVFDPRSPHQIKSSADFGRNDPQGQDPDPVENEMEDSPVLQTHHSTDIEHDCAVERGCASEHEMENLVKQRRASDQVHGEPPAEAAAATADQPDSSSEERIQEPLH
ncbi:hypothetical protein NE237_008998 [Protea cynaroides]|uniref:Uncharacterized protein n=1 Tax=Protea cynaroides TaxID=273540 RepID=A0A9Q0KWL1_9MAGN|nr:hypothetical protein NE237_008998 [Protea cynaroides]